MEVHGLPSRRFFRADRWERDALIDRETGFLKEGAVGSTLSMGDLLKRNAVLVLGPPWMGKTDVADRTYGALTGRLPAIETPGEFGGEGENRPAPADRPSEFGKFVCETKFEEWGNSTIGVPTWWDEWKTSSSRACWIVDAVDEHKQRGDHAWDILGHLNGLDANNRGRLCLVLFCRESEQDEKFIAKINELYPEIDTELASGLLTVKLARLDEQDARDFVGDSATFDQVVELVKQHGLQSLAGRPAALGALKELIGSDAVTPRDVWKRVLERVIREPRLDRRDAASSVVDQFRAAARIAAVATFGGRDVVDRGYGA